MQVRRHLKSAAVFATVASCTFLTVSFGVDQTAKKAPVRPRIVSSERTDCRGDTGSDPSDTCMFERIVVENPLVREVEVTLSCGDDLDEQTVRVFPRTRQTFELELTVPGRSCQIRKWR